MQKKGKIKTRGMPKPMWYKQDPSDERQLILKNGTRIRKSFDDVGLYCTRGGKVYALSKYGLLPRTIQFLKKNNYGKKTANGVRNGQRYPYVIFRDKKYDVHLLVALAWIGVRKEGEEIDHINGNIDDCRMVNLRIVTKEENRRRAKILRRLRHAARALHDPSLDPRNIEPQRLEQIFATLTVEDYLSRGKKRAG